MSRPISTERRVLTAAEFDAVANTHFPALFDVPGENLLELARLVREYRDKAQDVTPRRRRARRGKAEPRGAGPAPDETGTALKAAIFAAAAKRVNREMARREDVAQPPTQGEIAQRALEMRRATWISHHPGAGRTASRGMRSSPNRGDTVRVDPREVGRVSQSVKAAQARRDA